MFTLHKYFFLTMDGVLTNNLGFQLSITCLEDKTAQGNLLGSWKWSGFLCGKHTVWRSFNLHCKTFKNESKVNIHHYLSMKISISVIFPGPSPTNIKDFQTNFCQFHVLTVIHYNYLFSKTTFVNM